MVEVTVLLNTVGKIQTFTAVASKKPYNITLTGGSYTVDAKSIISIFTLNTDRPLRMVADCESDDELVAAISELLVY